jgi:hypothetical protein
MSFCFSVQSSTGGIKLTGENLSTQGETCPGATLSTTNPTWTEPGSNLSLCGDRPVTNCLSHGTAIGSQYSSGQYQGCTNPRRHVTTATRFCTVVPNIYGSSVWNLLHITLLTPTILRWCLDFWKICALRTDRPLCVCGGGGGGGRECT